MNKPAPEDAPDGTNGSTKHQNAQLPQELSEQRAPRHQAKS